MNQPVYIIYPVPLETPEVWAEFKPFVERFARTYREFPPDAKCLLICVLNLPSDEVFNLAPVAELAAILGDIQRVTVNYLGKGCDIGSWQQTAEVLPNSFMVCCTTRVYFHRRGWLARLIECRETFGPGLYDSSCSREGGRLHACTRFLAMDSEHFKRYPMLVTSRDQGCSFEIGKDMRTGELNPHGSISEWFIKQGLQCNVVYWDDCFDVVDVPGAFWESVKNGYRRGTQENMLAFDKHTDLFRNADETEKNRLQNLCVGVSGSHAVQVR